jgi:hypothetical protein
MNEKKKKKEKKSKMMNKQQLKKHHKKGDTPYNGTVHNTVHDARKKTKRRWCLMRLRRRTRGEDQPRQERGTAGRRCEAPARSMLHCAIEQRLSVTLPARQ